MSHQSSGFLMGTVLGGTLATMAVLFFTTKQGHKIQREVVHKYHDIENTAKHYVKAKIKGSKHKRKAHKR